jgi:ribosomal protein S18 acetylase RimI-like enzyme
VLRIETSSGLDSLHLVTQLLQRVRLAHPTTGSWEAADLQWWWRVERPSDIIEQTFWLDEAGPVAAVIVTDWGRTWGCDPVVLADHAGRLGPVMWAHAEDRIEELRLSSVDVAVRDDDLDMATLVTAAGFAPASEHGRGAATWMHATERPAVVPLRAGYRLRSRAEVVDRLHHFVRRADEHVTQRLAQASLYRPDLDLFVETKSGEVAAYGLFWNDPVTGVGLVEPMRTEEGHERRGLARHILTAGLDRLARLGATRLKVNYEVGNDRAQRLYLGAGFEVESLSTNYAMRRD